MTENGIMTAYSIIKKSQLEGATRLDAEYYNPDVLVDFSKGSWVKAVDILDFVQYGTSEDLNEDGLGYPTLRLNEFDNSFIEEPKKYCDKIDEKIFGSLKLKQGDVLICRTNGNPKLVGRSTIVMIDREMVFASYLFRVRTKKEILKPSVLMVYLNSRIGRSEIERFSLISNQTNFSPAGLREIQIPIFSEEIQKKIDSLITASYDYHEKSKTLYQQAEDLLLEELALEDFNVDEKLFSIVNLSNVRSAGRMDAEYFQVKYERLVEKIRRRSAEKLGNLVSMKKGIEVGAEKYQEAGKLFIRVSSLSKNGITDSDQKYLSDKLYDELKDEFESKKGEILLTKDATLGIAYFLKEDVEGIVSSGVLRLQLKADVEGEYLALCLNSLVGQMQAERDAGGSIIAHWKPEQIRNIFIPILPKETQIKISDLVRKSHEARKKAKELFDEAKQMVEEMVESSY